MTTPSIDDHAQPPAAGTPGFTREIRSLLLETGELRVMLVTRELAPPADDEVIVRMEAAPINPSDIGQLFSVANLEDVRDASVGGTPGLVAQVPAEAMSALALRVGASLPTGNEGAGIVVRAGGSEAARLLLGRAVALLGGGMYAEYRCVKVTECLVLPAGTTPEEGASCFVNPLTALGFVETARREGHSALVHTAAASNLGRMVNRLCIKDDMQLINIVRSPEQVALMRSEGARNVVDSSSPDFKAELMSALAATHATIAFDAIGGGHLASDILACMEVAANRRMQEFSRYGSTTHKHVYIYGGLDTGSVQFDQSFGKAWSVAGWLLTNFLQQTSAQRVIELKARVAAEIKTTFSSQYSDRLSLSQVLQPHNVRKYGLRATGKKFLVCPQRA